MITFFAIGMVFCLLAAILFSSMIIDAMTGDQKQGYALWCGICAVLAAVCLLGVVISALAKVAMS